MLLQGLLAHTQPCRPKAYTRCLPACLQEEENGDESESSDGFIADELGGGEDEVGDGDERERVFLVGVELRSSSHERASTSASYTITDSLEELGRLADTAGLRVSGRRASEHVGSCVEHLKPNGAAAAGDGLYVASAGSA